MEILSPCGCWSQAESAIKAGSSAVYGGLKSWNARNNAINFSFEELNSVISLLHQNNILFYLTLNTLVLDNEITEIISYLKNPKYILPDAVIVTDIGLIQRIIKELPSVPVHISTQFGVHCIEDIEYLQDLNVNRVILARELTMNEIVNLKKHSKLEIECFVWGSQCVSFSGLCFLGSFLNGGSGNRGKCLNICRDIYEVNSTYGNYLYMPDMNCINVVDKISDIIDSLKIEGRRRSPEEICKVIHGIQNGHSEDEQRGFIYGVSLEDNNLFKISHNRNKRLCKANELTKIDVNDVFVEYKNEQVTKIIKGMHMDLNSLWYLYSEYNSEYKLNKKNLFFDFTVHDNEIIQIDYTNHKGEFNRFSCSDYKSEKIEISIKDIVYRIEKIYPILNVCKIKYMNLKSNDKFLILKELLSSLEKHISIYYSDYSANNTNKNIYQQSKNIQNNKIIYVETDNQSLSLRLKKLPDVKVIFNIKTMQELEQIDDIISKLDSNHDIIFKLPLFNWKSINTDKLYKKLENRSVMFTRISQIYAMKRYSLNKKYSDYTIPIWNTDSVNLLSELGIEMFTASPELSYEQNKSIFRNQQTQILLAGKVPLGYSRQCFKDVFHCNNCEYGIKKEIKNVSKNINFNILCNSDYREILSNIPVLNNFEQFSFPDNFAVRVLSYDLDPDELFNLIDLYKNNVDYYSKLIKKDYWMKSYELNIFDSKT